MCEFCHSNICFRPLDVDILIFYALTVKALLPQLIDCFKGTMTYGIRPFLVLSLLTILLLILSPPAESRVRVGVGGTTNRHELEKDCEEAKEIIGKLSFTNSHNLTLTDSEWTILKNCINSTGKMVYFIVAISAFVAIFLAVIFYNIAEKKKVCCFKKNEVQNQDRNTAQNSTE